MMFVAISVGLFIFWGALTVIAMFASNNIEYKKRQTLGSAMITILLILFVSSIISVMSIGINNHITQTASQTPPSKNDSPVTQTASQTPPSKNDSPEDNDNGYMNPGVIHSVFRMSGVK